MKKISVIIPMLKNHPDLKDRLIQFISRCPKDFEIICIPDSPSGDLTSHLSDLQTLHDNVRLVSDGSVLSCAGGEYIVFLSPDQHWDPTSIQQMLEYAGSADLCVCECCADMDALDQVLDGRRSCSPEEIKDLLFTSIDLSPWNKLFKASLLHSLGEPLCPSESYPALRLGYLSAAKAEEIRFIGNLSLCSEANNCTESFSPQTLIQIKTELKKLHLYSSFERSFLNSTLKLCMDLLRRCRTLEEQSAFADTLKQSALNELGILGHTKGYFFSKSDFSMMTDLFRLSQGDFWKKHARIEKDRVIPHKHKIDIDQWVSPKTYPKGGIKISVVIPCYNAAHYLQYSIPSVLKQTLQDFELICVNDGSTDNTLEILNQYAQLDPRIKVIDQKNTGVGGARNSGIAAASGEFLYFLDSDDSIHEKALEYMYTQMKERELDMLFFTTKTVYASEELHRKFPEFLNYYVRQHDYPNTLTGRELFLQFFENGEFKPSVALYVTRRQFIQESGISFRPNIIQEDQLFTPLCMSFAKRAAYDDVALHCRAIRKNSIMTGSSGIQIAYSASIISQEYTKFAEQHNLKEDTVFYDAFLRKSWQICDVAQRSLFQVPQEEITQFLHTLSPEDAFHFYFVIAAPSLQKAKHFSRGSALQDANENLISLREYSHALARQSGTLKQRVQKLDAERISLMEKTKQSESALHQKLQKTYTEKSELNKKLQQTYAEKSELNKKLQQTYAEKSQCRQIIQQQSAQLSEQKAALDQSLRQLESIQASRSYQFAQLLTRPFRFLLRLFHR